MTRYKTILYAALMGLASVAAAHPNHEDEAQMTAQRAAKLADQRLSAVVQTKKLNAAWLKSTRGEALKRTAGGRDVWVVPYKAAQGGADSALYLYFDDVGNFIDANHSGTPPAK